MLDSKTILIADGSIYAALDLAQSIEANEGCVAGPVSLISEALTIVDSREIAGAIVDCELPQASVLILRLAEVGVPVVVQTSVPLPLGLGDLEHRLPVLMRPIDPRTVINTLVDEIGTTPKR
jgi:hypothetical protein